MKILITNNSLNLLAGSELFVYDLACALIRLNHDVHIIAYEDFYADEWDRPYIDADGNKQVEYMQPDILPLKLLEAGVKLISSVDDLHKDYDVIHYQHNNIASFVNHWLPDTPSIFVSHGVVFEVCTPNVDIKFDKVVAVSEEIKLKLTIDGFKDVQVINNVIDTQKFEFLPKKYDEIKTICIASNHAGKPCKKIGVSCEAFNKYKDAYFMNHCFNECNMKPFNNILKISEELKGRTFNVGGFTFINQEGVIESKNNSVWDVENAYKTADLVCGIGRSALQAMAMGVPTLVYDHFGYVGFIKTEKQFREIQRTNFSGRPWQKIHNEFPVLDTKKLRGEYELQKPRLKWLSDLVISEYGSEVIAEKYVNLYKEIIDG